MRDSCFLSLLHWKHSEEPLQPDKYPYMQKPHTYMKYSGSVTRNAYTCRSRKLDMGDLDTRGPRVPESNRSSTKVAESLPPPPILTSLSWTEKGSRAPGVFKPHQAPALFTGPHLSSSCSLLFYVSLLPLSLSMILFFIVHSPRNFTASIPSRRNQVSSWICLEPHGSPVQHYQGKF